jgi:NADH-quinone oxidoreductase subunit L
MFKALLFLGAGSVIHAVHSNDMRHMGGLRKKMPITAYTFLVGCVAIAGIPPFAGFFSKDQILEALHEAQQGGLYMLASAVAFLTAFYMFRLYFMTFEGSEPAHGHPHESPATMTVPLIVLALLSLTAGWTSLNKHGHAFGDYIHFQRGAQVESDWRKARALAEAQPTVRGDYRAAAAAWEAAAGRAQEKGVASGEGVAGHSSGEGEGHGHAFKLNLSIAVPATLTALAGILLAFLIYRRRVIAAEKIARAFGPLYTLVYNKYYVDEFYRWLLDKIYYQISKAIAFFDRYVVDGLMNGFAWAAQVAGGVLRRLQTGRAQAYAMGMLLGVGLLFVALKVLVHP